MHKLWHPVPMMNIFSTLCWADWAEPERRRAARYEQWWSDIGQRLREGQNGGCRWIVEEKRVRSCKGMGLCVLCKQENLLDCLRFVFWNRNLDPLWRHDLSISMISCALLCVKACCLNESYRCVLKLTFFFACACQVMREWSSSCMHAYVRVYMHIYTRRYIRIHA